MNQQTVIQLAQEGNTEAFRQLFDENKQKIFSLAYRYAKNAEDAEDILQETFIKAYNSLHKFHVQQETEFSAWVYRIGINCSIDHLRKNKIKKDKYIDVDNMPNISSNKEGSDPEHSSLLKEVRKSLEQVLNKLPARQRMIFILRHYQQLSIKEIAEYLKCSEGSVKKQLFRAFSEVKKQFKRLVLENKYEMQKV